MSDRPTVATFRPDDDRTEEAVSLLRGLGADPIADPMLAIEPTGSVPRTDADYVVLTSKTGVELAADADWSPGETTVVAIGDRTARALREAGYEVDLLPEEYTSSGLVDLLSDRADGARIEIARSDHGSDVLLDGLEAAGAYVHETVLYRLTLPEEAGDAAERAADGSLDAALFTSSLTVDHFLTAADRRGVRSDALDGLDDAVVGAIGPPTKETARDAGVPVDVVPDTADFEALARTVLDELERRSP